VVCRQLCFKGAGKIRRADIALELDGRVLDVVLSREITPNFFHDLGALADLLVLYLDMPAQGIEV
jgi:hypothetical protein